MKSTKYWLFLRWVDVCESDSKKNNHYFLKGFEADKYAWWKKQYIQCESSQMISNTECQYMNIKMHVV